MIETVERALVEQLGFLPRRLWLREIPRAVRAASTSLGLDDDTLVRSLGGDPGLVELVAGHLTVGETYFFRHLEHFRSAVAFLRGLAPTTPRRLRVWSAGCSTGEEPYSLVLELLETAPVLADRVEIVATDLDPEAIRAAETGRFGPWSFRQNARPLPADAFGPGAAPGERELGERVRRRVAFRCEPIGRTLERTPPASFDLVVYRNVGIYLDEAARARVFAGLAQVLRPEGRLVVAPGDPRPARELFVPVPDATTCWYRPTGPADRETATAPSARTARPRSNGAPVARSPRHRTTPRPAPLEIPFALRSGPDPLRAVVEPADRESAIVREAARRADRGELDRALALLEEVVEPGSPVLRLRGSLRLAAERPESALADFRMLLFRDPGDRLARYWLALVLRELGLHPRARAQLRQLAGDLAATPPRGLLEDGTTTAAQLLVAVRQRLEETR